MQAEELATELRYYRWHAGAMPAASAARAVRPRPQPRRLILEVDGRAALARRFVKARDAIISIPELADEASPPPWGWTIASQDRFRDLRCSVYELIADAATNLETGVPPWMRDHPQIKAQVRAVRSLVEDGRPFTVVIHEAPPWKTTGGGDCASEATTAASPDADDEWADRVAQSSFEPGSGLLQEVFGEPGVTPVGLSSLDLDGVASFIRSGACRSVVLLTGAGISTASGIPDYRGSGGLWKTVAPERLSATAEQREKIARDPEWVASIGLFQENPLPLLELKRDFVIGLAQGRWRPTLAHFFVKLLHSHGLLTRVLTQNIDGLHQAAGVPEELVTEVHGTIRMASCRSCGYQMGLDEFAAAMTRHVKDVSAEGGDPQAPAASTPGGLPCPRGCSLACVRPQTVLFGEQVNLAFQDVFRDELPKADLLIILGTSVSVAPVGKAPAHVGPGCVRLVVNNCRVGENAGLVFDSPAACRDIMAEGDIDTLLLELAERLGWAAELRQCRLQMAEASALLFKR